MNSGGFEKSSGGFEGSSGGFGGFDRKPSGTNLWEKEFEVMKQTNVQVKSKSSANDWSNTFEESSSNNNK